MTAVEPTYWPFPVPPPEKRTEEMKRIIQFMEAADAAGFGPCTYHPYYADDYAAESPTGRFVSLIYRGVRRWEVILCDATSRVMAFWVGGFETAGAAALHWLQGGTPEEVAAVVEGHVLRGRAEALTPQPVPVTPA